MGFSTPYPSNVGNLEDDEFSSSYPLLVTVIPPTSFSTHREGFVVPNAIGSQFSTLRQSSGGATVSIGIDGRQLTARTCDNIKIALGSITISEIGDNAVDSDEIINSAVTAAKLSTVPQADITTLEVFSQIFADITAVTATTPTEVNDDDSYSYPDASTTGARTSFEVPNDYDDTGNVEIYLRISPSTSFVGNFRIETDYRVNGGSLVGATQTTVTPSATADTQTIVGPVLTIAAANISPNDAIAVRILRLGADAADTHTGAMRLFSAIMRYTV